MLTVSFATRDAPPGPDPGREVNVWRDDTGRIFARGYSDGRRHRVAWPDLGTFDVRHGSLEVEIHPAGPGLEDRAEDAVTRVLQPMLLQALGWQALHASAIAFPDGVVAFCGRSGQGKSTLAYAASRRRAGHFADDAVLLDVGASGVTAIPLPFTPRLRPESLTHFSAPRPSPPREAAPLRLVILLDQRPDAAAATVEPVAAAPAFSALVTHAHCFDPAPGQGSERLVRQFLAVAEQVPVVTLTYPSGFDRIAGVVDAVFGAAANAGVSTGPTRRVLP